MKPPAPRKAVVFTESRRTQIFLKEFLEANGHTGKVVILNGSNNDPDSKQTYESWASKNCDTGRMTGSRPVDSRTAIIDAFRDSAEILIATEAAAEGINLQFCALVINFDLPWNPQRIEQRIGRCHRYGQEHDVVVITRFELTELAAFDDDELAFDLRESPITAARPGHYRLIQKGRANIPGEFLYRLNHPLGEHTISQGKGHPCPPAEVVFDISAHPAKVSVIEQLEGKSGWLTLQHLRIDSLDREEYLLFSAFDDDGHDLNQETCEKLFTVAGTTSPNSSFSEPPDRLTAEAKRHVAATLNRSLETNHRHFQQARDQFGQWAEDMELASQKQLEDLKRQIRDLQRRSRQVPTLQEEKAMQDQILKLEQAKRRQRQRIFEIEDEIEEKRKALVTALESRLQQKTQTTPLFTVRWRVV